MMVYFDPSLLVALYLPEERTPKLRRWLASQRSPCGLNAWQELEFRNAARQKVLRGEAAEGDLARTFRVFDDDSVRGRIIRRTVPWNAAFIEAERLSRKFALSQSCRSFDLLHIAMAIISQLSDFATLDTQQAELATTAGLTIIDLPP